MPGAHFPTTRRSIVEALADEDEPSRRQAFDMLVSLYWRPLYKYARFRRCSTSHDAEDLTQSFFARVFESGALSGYDPSRGAFRPFLRLLFDRHATNEWKAASRLRRGGRAEHLDFAAAESELALERHSGSSPDEVLDREWARSVFALAVERLRGWACATGRLEPFAIFEAYDLSDDAGRSYRDVAARFGTTVVKVTNHLSAMRRRFREIVIDILREATATDRELRLEIRSLLGKEQ